MSRGRISILLYLILSTLLGIGAGEWFFRMFDQFVPAAVTTNFNRTAAHGYFLLNGAALGIVIFLWGIAAVFLAPMLRRDRSRADVENAGRP